MQIQQYRISRNSLLFFCAIVLSASFFLQSCKKDDQKPIPAVSLNVFNGSDGVNNALVKTPYTSMYFGDLAGVPFGTSFVFTIPAGKQTISIAGNDTTKILGSLSITPKGTDIYSLFIAGAGGNDIILNRDTIPYYADSSFGVRFVNLNYQGGAVNLQLSTSTGTNEFSNVAYKSITGFKAYPGPSANPTYNFQVTDANDSVLAFTDIPPTMFERHNVTLVFSPAGLIIMDNF